MHDETHARIGHEQSHHEPLLDEAAVADYLDFSPRTIRRWRRAGYLPAIPMPGGRGHRYRRADIDDAIQRWQVG